MSDQYFHLKDYLKSNANINFNYLITSISYENRGFSSIEILLEKFKFKDLILINFGQEYLSSKLQKEWKSQRIKLIELFNEYKQNFIEIKCSPIYLEKSINKIHKIIKNPTSVNINITTFPKNYILRLAQEFDYNSNIFFYYKNLKYREPSEEEFKIGIEKILPIEGFEGEREINHEDLLVLILGYEGHRALSFLSQFKPYKILPIISIPDEGNIQIDNEYKSRVIKCNKKLLSRHSIIKDDNDFYTITANNHVRFSKNLENIINKHKNLEVDICVSPLGTKAQALGLYLYWKKYPETQIIYSIPIERFDLSTKKGQPFIYKLS